VTHSEAINTLLAALGAERESAKHSAGEYDAAETHVLSCSACWSVVCQMYERVTQREVPSGLGAQQQFACDAVGDDLWTVVGLSATEVQSADPQLAKHLAGCQPCREHLTLLTEVEAEAARGDYGPSIVTLAEGAASVAAKWRSVVDAAGNQLREAIGGIVVRVRDELASFQDIPAWFTPVPVVAGARSKRAATAGVRPRKKQSVVEPVVECPTEVQFPVGDTGMIALISVRPIRRNFVQLSLLLTAAPGASASVELKSISGGKVRTRQLETLRAGEPFRFTDLRVGEYAFVIIVTGTQVSFRIPFRVEGQK